jgi:hypothetical protein
MGGVQGGCTGGLGGGRGGVQGVGGWGRGVYRRIPCEKSEFMHVGSSVIANWCSLATDILY